jgi:hypothetical protein
MITCSSGRGGFDANTSFNCFLDNIELDGGNGTNIPSSIGTRHGVWMDAYSTNGVMKECNVHSFNGCGIYVAAVGNVSGGQLNQGAYLSFSHNQSASNYFGFYFPESTSVPWQASAQRVAYFTANDLAAYGNRIGIWLASGNTVLHGGWCENNGIGMFVTDNGSGAHGKVESYLLNHNFTYNLVCSNVVNGMRFGGCCSFLDDMLWTNCNGVVYENGILDGCTVTITNGGQNIIQNNQYVAAPNVFLTNGLSIISANNKMDGTVNNTWVYPGNVVIGNATNGTPGTPGSVNRWMTMTNNGTLYYVPLYK